MNTMVFHVHKNSLRHLFRHSLRLHTPDYCRRSHQICTHNYNYVSRASNYKPLLHPLCAQIRNHPNVTSYHTPPDPSQPDPSQPDPSQPDPSPPEERFPPSAWPNPEYDWKYLCDEKNTEIIRKNIIDRKKKGNIDALVSLWKQTNGSIDASSDEMNELNRLASQIPNRTHPETPIGDEDQNKVVRMIGTPKTFDFPPLSVLKLGQELDGLRTENVGQTSGPRTYYFLNDFAQLEQALIRYCVDFLSQHGFLLVTVPDLLHPHIIEACGFDTKGEHAQVYRLHSQHGDVCLAGTGEMGLGGYILGQRFTEKDLPKRYMTVSRCYRAEVSGIQKSMGIYRIHQFTKVEMFVLSGIHGDESARMLDELVALQCSMFEELGLHCRLLDMATHELAAPAYRKYDIETWLPVHNMWGEISSTSSCLDYQSRRLDVKYVRKEDYLTTPCELHHVHTLNGTACAIPRMILSLVETHQTADKRVHIPEVLQPYMNGKEYMTAPDKRLHMEWIKVTKGYKKKQKEQKLKESSPKKKKQKLKDSS